MITPILEKLLLTNKAKNRIHHIGFGSFAQLEIPDNNFIVIHKVYWNGWINQKDADITKLNWKDFFRYSEYAMKIQSDKEPPFILQMRNEINFQYYGAAASMNFSSVINKTQYDTSILMQPKKPVIFDTWIASYDYLNFTVTRNALMPDSVTYNKVNNYAEEKDIPNGVNDQAVLLNMTLVGTNGTQETYNPPGVKASKPPIVSVPNDNVTSYIQRYDKGVGGGDNGSFINNPLSTSRLTKSEFVNNPLISFEYCIISKQASGIISSF